MRVTSISCLAILLGTHFLATYSSPATANEDEVAARQVVAGYQAAWNTHDMGAFAQLFTLDCDYIVWTGKQLKGRAEIFSYHDELHKGKFRDRQLSAEWKDFRFVNDRVAIGHVSFAGSGPSSDGRGNTNALATLVVTKLDGKWLIDAFHNTLLSSDGSLTSPAARESAQKPASEPQPE